MNRTTLEHSPAANGATRLPVMRIRVACQHAGEYVGPTRLRCNLGLYDGSPHVSVCEICTKKVPVDLAPCELETVPKLQQASTVTRNTLIKPLDRVAPAPVGKVEDWRKYFDRIVVINLKRRPDRLAKFRNYVNQTDWPFQEVEVFEAVDGDKVGTSYKWKTGGGSYGCMRSHTRILEQALMDDVQRILIFEDDAYFPRPDSFRDEITRFLSEVPSDWDALWIGGQHVNRNGARPPKPVRQGIVRCSDAERTHCFALQGKVIRDLYRRWVSCEEHIDWVCGPFLGNYNTYAPNPFIAGQDGGKSDISGRNNVRQNWSKGKSEAPVVWLKCDRSVLEELRHIFHSGYTRNREGIDVGLQKIFDEMEPGSERMKKLREWVVMIRDEAHALGQGAVATIYHPSADAATTYNALSGVIEIDAASVDDAKTQLAQVKLDSQPRQRVKKVYWIRTENRGVIEELRANGFHFGNWRDSYGRDRGLCEISEERDANAQVLQLRAWLEVIERECATIGDDAVPALWHECFSADIVIEAFGQALIEIVPGVGFDPKALRD